MGGHIGHVVGHLSFDRLALYIRTYTYVHADECMYMCIHVDGSGYMCIHVACCLICRELESRRDSDPGFNITLDDFGYFQEEDDSISGLISGFMQNATFKGISVSLHACAVHV